MKCPYCVKGTKTGPNGESWRCSSCGGTGQIVEGPREKPAGFEEQLDALSKAAFTPVEDCGKDME